MLVIQKRYYVRQFILLLQIEMSKSSSTFSLHKVADKVQTVGFGSLVKIIRVPLYSNRRPFWWRATWVPLSFCNSGRTGLVLALSPLQP